MTYKEFIKFVQSKCMHETIYEDSEGRLILVIDLLDAYGMVNKLSQPTGLVDSKLNPTERTWVGLTDEEVNTIYEQAEVLVHDSWVGNGTVGLMFPITLYKMFEAKLKEKNT